MCSSSAISRARTNREPFRLPSCRIEVSHCTPRACVGLSAFADAVLRSAGSGAQRDRLRRFGAGLGESIGCGHRRLRSTRTGIARGSRLRTDDWRCNHFHTHGRHSSSSNRKVICILALGLPARIRRSHRTRAQFGAATTVENPQSGRRAIRRNAGSSSVTSRRRIRTPDQAIRHGARNRGSIASSARGSRDSAPSVTPSQPRVRWT
jgi:hypothetical protein